MDKISLDAVAREQLRAALAADSRRSATTVQGGHHRTLRQTVIALASGARLDEHENPGEATVQVLAGRITLSTASGTAWEGRTGDLITVPDERHGVEAHEDSAILLTVCKGDGA